MAKCKEINPSQTDFKNPKSIISSLLNLFKLPPSVSQSIPSSVILASQNRPGLSPSKMAARVIQRQAEAGIPVGVLPSGRISPDEIMEVIRMEEICNALTQDARIQTVTQAGTSLSATGGNAGGPIQVVGTLVDNSKGWSMMT